MTIETALRCIIWAYVIGWPLWCAWQWRKRQKRKDAEFKEVIARIKRQVRQARIDEDRQVHLSRAED